MIKINIETDLKEDRELYCMLSLDKELQILVKYLENKYQLNINCPSFFNTQDEEEN